MPRQEAYRFILSAQGLRAEDIRALRKFEISDQEGCQLLVGQEIRGKDIEEFVQNNRPISRRDAVRRIASSLLEG